MLHQRKLVLLITALLITGGGCDTTRKVERSRTSPDLVSFETCEVLERNLKANLTEQMRVHLLSLDETGFGFIEDDVAEGGLVPSNPGGRQEGVDYSGTNNQETDVDEGDFVKTDGYYLYVLSGNQLVIMGVPEFGQLAENVSILVRPIEAMLLVLPKLSQ